MVKRGMNKPKEFQSTLFSGSVKELNTEELDQAFGGVPAYEVGSDDSLNLVEILIAAGIDSSKRQAREDINNGAIYLNGDRIQDTDYEIQEADKLGGKTTVIRRGKKIFSIAFLKKRKSQETCFLVISLCQKEFFYGNNYYTSCGLISHYCISVFFKANWFFT